MNPTLTAGSVIMIATACSASVIVGQVRVQPLSPYLVRIEQKGPSGFEDRRTFTVEERNWDAIVGETTSRSGKTFVATEHYRVSVPDGAATFEGVRIETPKGRLIHKLTAKDLGRAFLPDPSALPACWVLADNPRAVPPPWGALPPPDGVDHPHSGWDLTNHAPDLYVFFPQASGYEAFRAEFLKLTGPVPLPPLYTFGVWYSRYHPYSEDQALEVIDTFRRKNIPLDLFVADTDWRVGASHGYAVNTNLFPDMRRFIDRAHGKNVRVMYNDHPEPVGTHAMDPKELRYRRDGLTSLLEMGADVWWFDRNWHTHLQSPVEGLNKEVWGMRLYHDITLAHRPARRPLVMSNVDGISHGRLEAPSHPAAHRFPVWWTGDTLSQWEYLRLGVQNGVDCGIHSLLPYVNEDLGGHIGMPDEELYTRYMQFGALSPVTRIHSTAGTCRYPWQYGEDTEKTVGDYFRLRYRLLPTLYAAAFEAHRTGSPILRRCDLEWPTHPEARDNTQYLLGNDLLVAPILAAGDSNRVARRNVWIPEGEWEDAWTGRTHTGPAVIGVAAPLAQVPVFIRRGGIVATLPQTYFTRNDPWTNVVLDAFVPSRDGATERLLYEDDGETTAYTNGAAGLTRLSIERQGGSVTLAIQPSAELRQFTAGTRTWTIRLHLPRGAAARPVEVNGKPAESRVIEPAAGDLALLFEGAGSAPAAASGAVIEVTVPDHPCAEALSLGVKD